MLRIYLLLFFLVSQLQAQTTMIIPPNLQKGDTIAIVATARKNIVDNLKPALDLAKSWGLNVVIGKTIGLDNHQLAGTDEERAADFQEMIDNPNIKAVSSSLPIITQINDFSDINGGVYNNHYTMTYNWNSYTENKLEGNLLDLNYCKTKRNEN